MSDTYDVIVIGCGAMGASASMQLASRGVRTLCLDQFGVPHSNGSSHGLTRMLRMCYFEHPDYVPLIKRAVELWRELEGESGQELLELTGGLYLGAEDDPLIRGSLSAARRHHLPFEMIDADGLAERWPQFRPPRDVKGFFEPGAGMLFPERIITACAALAARHGAALHLYEPVVEFKTEARGVRVRTEQATYTAASAVVCAGAWTSRLLGELGVELRVTRQSVAWCLPDEPGRFTSDRFPVWAIGHGDGTLDYGFPMIQDAPGMKIARHKAGELMDPYADRLEPDADEARKLRDALERLIPGAGGPVMSIGACMYANSPDAHFIIDRLPDHANVSIACGFSGHGFKFASVVGEILADLAIEGATSAPIDFLSLSRFRRM